MAIEVSTTSTHSVTIDGDDVQTLALVACLARKLIEAERDAGGQTQSTTLKLFDDSGQVTGVFGISAEDVDQCDKMIKQLAPLHGFKSA